MLTSGRGRDADRYQIWPPIYCQYKPGAALLGCAAVSLWLPQKLVQAVQARLSDGLSGAVAVVDYPRMSRALTQAGCQVSEIEGANDSNVTALVVRGLAQRDDWGRELRALRAQLAPGGQLLTIDKGDASEVSRRLLCSGLSDLRQRIVGRSLLTCGFVPLR